MARSLIIAGTQSGVGKTTITLGIIGALTRRGLKVQPFKAGPDFIDPGLHRLFLGGKTPSHNLDTWIMEKDEIRRVFFDYSDLKDLALVEGVMGLFDGVLDHGELGSTAHLAKLLGIPVVLVVGCRGVARSILPIIKGFLEFDQDLVIKGVIFNGVGSKGHGDYLRRVVEEEFPNIKVIGALERTPDISIPSRHLGLFTDHDISSERGLVDAIIGHVERSLDLDALIEISEEPPLHTTWQGPGDANGEICGAPVTIGIPRDEAFSFYYEENLSLLEKNGAQLAFFSPIHDHSLPAMDALYIGGGYPELYAEALSQNQDIIAPLRSLIKEGLPCYGECGGMMYLSKGIYTQAGIFYPMVGALPFSVRMLQGMRSLGYREVMALESCILGGPGTRARGHEFHYSELVEEGSEKGVQKKAYQTVNARGRPAGDRGILEGNVLASYVHLHFSSNLSVAKNFVDYVRGEKNDPTNGPRGNREGEF